MAHVSQLPCDGDGVCMLCKAKPSDEEKLTCKTCVTPWHAACLAPSSRPETLASTAQWECPDCTSISGGAPAVKSGESGDLIAKIQAIMADESLTEEEKAKKRQELMSGKAEVEEEEKKGAKKDVLDVLDGIFNCSFCMQLPERPVTTPCGHNFCLKCFQKWVGQRKHTCAKCRAPIPQKMASQPRINSSLVIAIRMAKLSKSHVTGGPAKVYHYIQNQDRPDKAYTTERAQKTGKANAASGKIFVTIPSDHFGPIPAENDPERNQGVMVGECWEDRLECRQWGAHFPHVSGIAGQSNHGAQSVVLSGGYLDDEDHGEWFLYTGSGGRDLSGNKRTNKDQSFDQTFEKYNKALQVSCQKGYPVRVVRSHKEKRSAYAPEKGLRYDGVYRIEKCWRKVGVQGFKVCRYLFVRCDNEPAPWTSDEHGDRPRPLPAIPELAKATNITERNASPSWDFEEKDGCWKWIKAPPISKKPVQTLDPADRKRSRKAMRKAQNMTVRERLLKEFSCLICRQVMTSPVTTSCGHNFCKSCFQGAFVGKSVVTERNRGGRSLRTQKNVLTCPSCPTDVTDFVQNPQVNTEIMKAIESLNEEEANVDSADESSEEMDIPDNENSTEDAAVIDGEQTSPTKCNPKGSPKRLKVDTGNDSPKSDIVEVNEISVLQTNDVNRDTEMEIAKESNEVQAPVATRGKKTAGRAGQGVGAKTRGTKKAKEAVSEENGSPSSNEVSAVHTNDVNGDSDLDIAKEINSEMEIAKESNEVPAPVAKRGKKIAGQAGQGVGAKTRGRKKVKEAASEDNGLPSSNEVSAIQTSGVNGDSDLDIAKESNEFQAPVAKRGKKAAAGLAVEGVGSRTRGRKKAKVAASEENGSPSSPLHVDVDFK
ncbi:E3 ubiquitin-protein ligase ORTHRUS 2 [Rosa sericea]